MVERGDRILIVEDEPAVRAIMSRVLGHLFDVTVARDGVEAVALIEQHGPAFFGIVICDLEMPRMNGKELYRCVEVRWPELRDRFLFVSANIATFAASVGSNFPDERFVEKPFSAANLLDKARRLMGL